MNRLVHISVLIAGLLGAAGCFPAPTLVRVIDGKVQRSRYVSPSAYEHYLRAELHLRRGDADNALTELNNALAFDSESAYLHTRKASVLFRLQRSEEAEQSLDAALNLVTNFPDALILRGDQALGEGRKPLAEHCYRRCIAGNPGLAPCYLRLGELLMEAERLTDARAILGRLSRQQPKNPDGQMRLGAVCLRQLDYACAAKAYERALRGRADFESLIRISFIRQAQGEIKAAIRSLREAFDRSDGSAEIAARLLPLLDHDGDPRGGDDLLKVLSSAAKEPSKKAEVLALGLRFKRYQWVKEELEASARLAETSTGKRLLAEALGALGQWTKAEALLNVELQGPQWSLAANTLATLGAKRVPVVQTLNLLRQQLKRDDSRPELVYPLTQFLSRNALHAEAVALATRFQQTRKSDTDAIFNLAIALEKAGRWKESVSLVQRYLAAHPGSATAYNFIGYLYADKKENLRDAERMLNKALIRDPMAPHIVDSLGWLAYRQGRLEVARERLEWAYALDDSEPEVAAHLAEVLAGLKRLPRALKLYRRALELSEQDQLRMKYQRRIDALEKLRVGKR